MSSLIGSSPAICRSRSGSICCSAAAASGWRASATTVDLPPEPAAWPAVVAVVPARNEADVIARSIGSLLAQDYPGRRSASSWSTTTATTAPPRPRSGLAGASGRLTVLTGAPLPAGWTGKLWAMSQGVDGGAAAERRTTCWLTDADIAHAPDNSAPAGRPRRGRQADAGLADGAAADCGTWAERLLIPAFVFFFDMLYPVRLGERSAEPTSPAAAGGCMLARREALEAAGGIAAIRAEIIDDCALGALLKARGPDLARPDRHARSACGPTRRIGEIGRMVSRSAYAQLGYSPLAAGRDRRRACCWSMLAAPLLALVRRRACALARPGRLGR